ncbi:MAG: Co2+/Mg2+ efflux protein ApaG [Acidobacteriota bacterium]|nr:Co2+/Mg2+ efflux protein ApaG [Acidobacteriota bacterium]MDE2712710.1 Co2+/Mg2+ efflux protein ApaG [Acidobacteriota bacterium]MXW69902.1 Co2+/Mg2+ efflux protein ApaG [Acidobacteriota bacterium]MXX87148.1 Co2+/Mg2+ efflux protein ApaG [Acidobacteriota bacterium]MYE43233.1 Co2+/Mg2+ efflux protein ApaG [Acidobacteriota bacterium]
MRQKVFTSSATTRGIRVDVEARFADRRPEPDPAWLFQYDIAITNESEELVQLLSRHWVIEHGEGRVEEVRGPGVVGARPYLVPGESFHYSSWCPLRAPFGSMRGSYLMEIPGGQRFKVEIAQFTLSEPVTLH